ncbi:TIGR04338 family metallohydrolase [Mycobacterium avium subsp. hominissuis]|uniref:TIGR04338 family metallohydrolase n=1 Tax=Mycobacterium avium TaxID=1764 RepID=UPI0009FCE73B|nr:TIGR04338 family metallohydrolase [Mycobacterium avium]MBZ4631374.1 TIGR04338 family metallohydrolase [Mycobacterium avium subsp. hominissuis]
MAERDVQKCRVYHAEEIMRNMLRNCAESGNPVVTVNGITVTLPPEARFGSLQSVQDYIDRVLAHPAVVARFGPPGPVTVRARRGTTQAHYEPYGAVMAIPDHGSLWALRETVVLHEIAHHLDTSGGAHHGPRFVDTYLTLLEAVIGPEAALVMRVIYADNAVVSAIGDGAR